MGGWLFSSPVDYQSPSLSAPLLTLGSAWVPSRNRKREGLRLQGGAGADGGASPPGFLRKSPVGAGWGGKDRRSRREAEQALPTEARAPPLAIRLLVSPVFHAAIPEDEACELPEKEVGILWDAVCLTFLLIQRRIFLSYYHLYVVADLEAAQALASRYQESQEEDLSCQGLDQTQRKL